MRNQYPGSRFIRIVLFLALTIAVIVAVPASASPYLIYVKWDAQGSNTGVSWEDAFTDLQSALAVATPGYEVWVAGGTYRPGVARDDTFLLKEGVAIYGGFAGNETAREQRNPSAYVTILSGDLNRDDNGNISFAEPTRSENSYHVVTSSGNGNTAVLDGFTITGGNANLTRGEHTARGGGIWNALNAGPILKNLVISGNTSLELGGGMFSGPDGYPTLDQVTFLNNMSESGGGLGNYQSNPALSKVTFRQNRATSAGGGVANVSGSNPTFKNVTFFNNSSDNYAGGMGTYDSSASLTDVLFSQNSAIYGGGMFNRQSSPALTRVEFYYNSATDGGGMENFVSSSPTLIDVAFNTNMATGSGGGMLNSANSSPSLVNVTFNGNSAFAGGGMLNLQSSSPTLTNSTYYFNRARASGGGLENEGASHPSLTNVTFNSNGALQGGAIYNDGTSNSSIINSILYGDEPGGEIYNASGTAAVTYSIVQGGYSGAGNLDADPLLGMPQLYNGSFTEIMGLSAGSPAINAGSNTICPATDQRGAPRFDRCDMGSFEFVQYTISGNAGTGGVTLSYPGGTITSDNAGKYSLTVPYGWSGTITPSKANYHFSPESRSYENLQADQAAQDYSATFLISVSGNVGVAGAVLSYENDGLKTVTSDSQGNYTFIVPAGWSGTVTPSKAGATFTPPSRPYTNLQTNQTAQDYAAVVKVINTNDSGPGSLRQAVADVLPGAIITFDPALSGQTITVLSAIPINKSLMIDGSALGSKVQISGGNTVRLLSIGNGYAIHDLNVVLRSFVLRDAKGLGTSYFNTGAAILLFSSNTMTVEDLTFLSNSAVGDGAAINSSGTLTVIGSEFNSNASQGSGGAIYSSAQGRVTVINSKFLNNTAANAGAISVAAWRLSVENSTFDGNFSSNYGGAIIVSAGSQTEVTIKNNVFTRNQAISNFGAGYGGGGVFRSVLSGTTPQIMTFENNTFYANETTGAGGAILVETPILLRNNTFSDNKAIRGASLYLSGGNASLYNNIFANNTGGGECGRFSAMSMVQGSINIVEDGSDPCATLPGTIIADPMLGPLADNGGFTQTMALLPGSPAIDTGDDFSCTLTDQRGVARPWGLYCDIGAFEYYVTPPTNTPSPTPSFTATYTPTSTPRPTVTKKGPSKPPTSTPGPVIATRTPAPTKTPRK